MCVGRPGQTQDWGPGVGGQPWGREGAGRAELFSGWEASGQRAPQPRAFQALTSPEPQKCRPRPRRGPPQVLALQELPSREVQATSSCPLSFGDSAAHRPAGPVLAAGVGPAAAPRDPANPQSDEGEKTDAWTEGFLPIRAQAVCLSFPQPALSVCLSQFARAPGYPT